ncbi:G-type lectin S-receptor-like serine/threonine-protein kinase At4g27290 [Vigna umbellata]|uniref:G-type lectin S-receptor-like serine/threonine-protein kinase At4g27290 n=1 Tax=Vigna umbellata TaxID=87088 RepID=UPI001F5FAC52|nr:G-type lectin S-receptor-like serine/threonine-protein kinase At4g27290 [Vigna umbellata]
MENHHKHNKLTMLRVLFFCIFSTFLLSIQGTLTLTPNESIQGNTTMVSSAGTFEAGFFQFVNSQDQYFCIWYKNISPKTIVWVANRDAPVKNSTAFFTLTEQGVPVILDASGSVVWSSNSSRTAKKPVMQLLDSGNLVVQDGDSTKDLLWESFDYPGDTFLAGMKLRTNFVTGPFRFLTSWRNTEDPGFGEFSYHIDAHGYPQLVTTSGELLISRGGSWTGYAFTGVSWRRTLRLVKFSLESNGKEVIYQYKTLEAETITRLVINPAGLVQRLLWSGGSRGWEILSTRPMDQCDYYSFCDVNSLCNAWRLWIEEKPVELIDEVLDYPTTPLEVLRCIHVGLLCVQQTPQNRPNMSSVVLMLNGEKVLPEPSPPGFYTGTTQFPIQAESSSRSCGDRSQNEVTMSLLQPR